MVKCTLRRKLLSSTRAESNASRILQTSFTGRGDPEAAIGGDLSLDDILVGLSKSYIF